ncbi:glycosyltransferase family 2 protein [Paenibacillus sp. MER TA 81-3]|uniref:glycosyltransferase family 2 protein n=1 Tax=Paenibacillus sp. MER TA 81-3 TaxID=2939573 RepID=UPI002040FCB6|nr:glycosyltransferase family 2 protein [Paenibacillus sp. MER TA 81-3]MCM3339037.1 glycosyltransferase family 2 protein [Paenibacillus sp. MER TA 81-3]
MTAPYRSQMTSIIIPTHNRLALLRECVEAIQEHTAVPYEIIIVDNGSTDGTIDFCLQQGLTFVSLPDNRGFPAACNRGLQIASGEQLLLLNNDVVVSYRWLDNLLDALYETDVIGIVGPTTNYASGKQQVSYPYDDIQQFHRLTRSVNAPDPAKRQRVQRIVGLCFLFKRQLLHTVGLFDERFSPGHYEDDDYCYRARLQGYDLTLCGDVLVHHYGSASFRDHGEQALKELIERNYERFVEKWNLNPHLFM